MCAYAKLGTTILKYDHCRYVNQVTVKVSLHHHHHTHIFLLTRCHHKESYVFEMASKYLGFVIKPAHKMAVELCGSQLRKYPGLDD